jgi:hypothetical protein
MAILGILIVNFVLGLICFIAYSSQIFIIWPWYGAVLSIDLLELLLPFKSVFPCFSSRPHPLTRFSLLVLMLFWNYFLCVAVDPGRVPSHWVSHSLPCTSALSLLRPETGHPLRRLRSQEAHRHSPLLPYLRVLQAAQDTPLPNL